MSDQITATEQPSNPRDTSAPEVVDWPADPGEIPSPQLVDARLTLGTRPTERIPLWAAH
jgi:hypothetical protein